MNFFKQSRSLLKLRIKMIDNTFKAPPAFKIELNEDVVIAKKQVQWRIRNMGQLELEFLLLKWWEHNESRMTLSDLNQFAREVLEVENPVLNRKLVKRDEAPDSKYLIDVFNFHCKI
jgi:succinate dehydrogenase flavin-adding protein (antitoxin of CptAB toxin-antitoxin module)